MKNVRDKDYIVTMPDGSRWSVPVEVIARDRADNYKDEFDGDIERSLEEDTWPLFEEEEFEIQDWAANNMNWEDVAHLAKRLPVEAKEVDFQEGWVNGDKEIR